MGRPFSHDVAFIFFLAAPQSCELVALESPLPSTVLSPRSLSTGMYWVKKAQRDILTYPRSHSKNRTWTSHWGSWFSVLFELLPGLKSSNSCNGYFPPWSLSLLAHLVFLRDPQRWLEFEAQNLHQCSKALSFCSYVIFKKPFSPTSDLPWGNSGKALK